jgi:hypothetical protein
LDVPCRASTYLTGTGGPTYLAIAILHLAPDSPERLTEIERQQTLRWLLQNQDNSGGFRGRTNKDADACYCFWCGGAIQVPSSFTFRYWFCSALGQILGATELVDTTALALFLGKCQFRLGGIAKTPGENAGRSLISPYKCVTDKEKFQTHTTRISLLHQLLCFHRRNLLDLHGLLSPWIL